jgi:UTP--glucose-1-phosphate uridylyltransferase
MISRAVIPAAGRGTRLLPATKAQPKEMLPVVDKPVIQYVVEEAVSAGIEDILIISGKEKRAIEDHFERDDANNESLKELEKLANSANLFYVRQREQKGLGDAISYAKSFTGDDPFVLLLGDTITLPNCTQQLMQHYERLKATIIAAEEVSKADVSKYGIIAGERIEGDIFHVTNLVEKPAQEDAPSNMAIIGRYVLTPAIFDAIAHTQPGIGGEIQLTDALRNLREDVLAVIYQGKRYDIGTKIDWIKANVQLFLQDARYSDDLRSFLRSLD